MVLTGEVFLLAELDGRTDLSCENSSFLVCPDLPCVVRIFRASGISLKMNH